MAKLSFTYFRQQHETYDTWYIGLDFDPNSLQDFF